MLNQCVHVGSWGITDFDTDVWSDGVIPGGFEWNAGFLCNNRCRVNGIEETQDDQRLMVRLSRKQLVERKEGELPHVPRPTQSH